MFKFLKEKLKTWIGKAKQEEKPVKAPKQKKPKKEKPKAKQKKHKEKLKTIEPIQDFNVALQKTEPNIEETIAIQEEIKQLEEPKAKKTSFFDKFKTKLTEEKFEEMFEELRLILLQNNVAFEVVEEIKLYLKEELVGKNLSEIKLEEKLKKAIEKILIEPQNFLIEVKNILKTKKPAVIAFVGINGSGKTTTIAKVTNYLKKNKLSVCLVAADTFRAASIEQLEKHAEKLKVPIIKKDYGSDPASVGFDGINYAKKNNTDVVLIDTAGRMNTKESLMKEMEKIIRVNNPDMKIFVGESITGNDATEQAKAFNDAINLTGIILSKADVDEKGGTAISVSYITKKPIFFLGTGQSYDDLEIFNKKKILGKLGLG